MRKLALAAAVLLPGAVLLLNLDSKLAAQGGRGAAKRIPVGMRAIAVQTPSVPAQLVPGSKVDVFLTVQINRDEQITELVLQNVEIWAVDPPARARGAARNLQSVTLLVTPDQAANLDVAQLLPQSRGTLHLVPRQPVPTPKRAPQTLPFPLFGPRGDPLPPDHLLRSRRFGTGV